MNVGDERLAAIRRMWTFQAFVWSLRALTVGLPLAFFGDLLSGWLAAAGAVLVMAGMVLWIPLRVQAFLRLDIPFSKLLVLGLRVAYAPLLSREPASPGARPSAGAVPDRAAPVSDPAEDRTAALAELRGRPRYRLGVWGCRLVLASTVACCGGAVTGSTNRWVSLIPVLGFIGGLLLIFPLRIEARRRLWLSSGRVMEQALKDMVNPTFF